MSRADDPAYPTDNVYRGRGLTIREEFAKAAMQGIAACSPDLFHRFDARWIARCAVEAADALIAELAKEPKP